MSICKLGTHDACLKLDYAATAAFFISVFTTSALIMSIKTGLPARMEVATIVTSICCAAIQCLYVIVSNDIPVFLMAWNMVVLAVSVDGFMSEKSRTS